MITAGASERLDGNSIPRRGICNFSEKQGSLRMPAERYAKV
jgi:hypothetical protein